MISFVSDASAPSITSCALMQLIQSQAHVGLNGLFHVCRPFGGCCVSIEAAAA